MTGVSLCLGLGGAASIGFSFAAAFEARLSGRVVPFGYAPFWLGLLSFLLGIVGVSV